MRLKLPLSTLSLLAGFLTLASSVHAADLQVIAKTPFERTDSQRASSAITATFNQPMIPLNDPATMGSFCPIVIEPKIAGRCRWQGTQTLSFEPAAALPPAHLFTVKIAKGTASQVSHATLADEVRWQFETLRPQLVSSRPVQDERWISLEPILYLHFNLPMNPKRVQGFIVLEERPLNGGTPETIALGVRFLKAEDIKKLYPYAYSEDGFQASTATVLALKPSRPLKPDHAYRLLLKEGLPPADGDLGLLSSRAVEFETYYTFRAKEFPSKDCLPSSFTLGLSNPVKYQDLLDHLTVSPSTPMPRMDAYIANHTGQRDPAGRRVLFEIPDIGFKPDSSYQFVIDGKLQDIFGNQLGETVRFRLDTDGYCPYLESPQGFGILESYLPPRHPVSVVNAPQAPVDFLRIADADVVPFFSHMRWSTGERTKVPGSIHKMVSFEAPRNVRYRSALNLDDVLAGKGGVAFTQIESNYNRSGDTQWLKAVDNVTRIGLTFKSSPDSILLWTTFLRTGAPARDIPLELRGDDNQILWQGRSDAQGFAKAPGWVKLGLSVEGYERPKLWAFAKDPKGTAVMSSEMREGIEPWRFNLPYEWRPKKEVYGGTLFTERGVYRPGEKVFVKGLVRKLVDGDWTASDLHTLRLSLRDARGAEVAKSTVTVSAHSSFDFAYLLKEEAPTGYWTLLVTDISQEDDSTVRAVESDEEDGETRSYAGGKARIHLEHSFRVEAFKPASFEVKVTPQASTYFSGDRFKATVDGWYLFGAPMIEAPIDWKLRLSPGYYAPPGFDDYSFGGGWWEEASESEKLLGSQNTLLDKNGKIDVAANLEAGKMPGPKVAVLEASVTSPDRQRLFGRTQVIVHQADVYLGVKPSNYFGTTAKSWSADIVTVRPDGRSASGISVNGELKRRQWLSVERAGVGGRLEWVNEQKEMIVSTFSFISTANAFTWTCRPQDSGEYILKLTAHDEQRRATESSTAFYVLGSGESWWAQNDTDIVEIVPDRKSYKPGEVAHLLVKSPYTQSRVLVTLEREGVIDHWLTTLQGNSNIISVPLTDAHVPNIFVGVMLVQGRAGTDRYSAVGDDLSKPQAKFGYVNLAVNPDGRRLKVQVKTDKTAYRPRERVNVSVESLNEGGSPALAELTIFAVDEGVLSLTGFNTPDIFSAFYGPRPLWVDTADSRLHIIGQRSYGEKGKVRGGGGGSGSPLAGIDLRSNFVPTAYWNSSVLTDAQGKAQVSFPLPDNLSRFRVMVVAATGKRFGNGDVKFTVSKPLLLRPSLPRFARVGDTFRGGVVVHNYGPSGVNATVGLEISGDAVSIEGAKERQVEIGAGKAVEITWNCKAVGLGQSAFRFRAIAGSSTDGLEWKLSVKPAERLQVVATSGVTDNSTTEALDRPKDIVLELGGLTASLSSTALAGLQDGIRFLLEYPYGCLEQRMSRSLPVIVSADLVSAFKLGSLGDLKAQVQKELDHLSDFQHPNGGFGYWPNPWKPDPFITAYTLEVAHLAGKEGYRLPEPVLARAASWLKSYLASRSQWAYPYSQSEDYCARAYTLYVLGLRGEAPSNYFMELYGRRDQIPYCGKAFLLKAAPLVMNDPKIIETLSAELMNQARIAPTSLHFEEPSETRMPWIHESTVLTTARVLQALLETKGGFPSDEKAVQWLVGERKAQSHWRTTQENAVVLRALQDFYRRYEKDAPDFQATVSQENTAGPRALWHETFQGRTLVARSKTWDLATFFAGSEQTRLTIRKDGTGRLYYTLRLRYAPRHQDKAAFEGFRIEKSVKPLYGSSKDIRAGSRAIVTLKVHSEQDRTFVVLDDPLPAGMEIVDPSFAVEGHEDVRTMAGEGQHGEYWGTFQRNEKYDDRILLFADFFSAGDHTYSYLVQATTPGEFHAPATQVEQMYEPEVYGHTASGELHVQP